jgi:hypothetical protein
LDDRKCSKLIIGLFGMDNIAKGEGIMGKGTKLAVLIIYVLLLIGLSCPWQKVGEPIYLGFLPAPMFYLILVQLGFVVVLGFVAFFTRFHGWIEDEEDFLRSLKKEVKP